VQQVKQKDEFEAITLKQTNVLRIELKRVNVRFRDNVLVREGPVDQAQSFSSYYPLRNPNTVNSSPTKIIKKIIANVSHFLL